MERHDDENQVQACQIITLIFENHRFEVDRQKLIQKSKYFAALFSPNLKEHYQLEYEMEHIKYSLEVFQVSFIPLFQKVHHRVNCLIASSIRYFVLCRLFFHNVHGKCVFTSLQMYFLYLTFIFYI